MHSPPIPPFRVHPLLRNGMAATLIGALPRRGLGAFLAASERRIVRVNDHTRVRLQIDRSGSNHREALLLLHGLAGSSESAYMVGTARRAVDAGLVAARLNARGCGGTADLTSETYHGGETEDLLRAAHYLVDQEGMERVHIAGFSIGGNQALALAAHFGASPPSWLGRVLTVSPCVDFSASAHELERSPLRRWIGRVFVRRLAAILRQRVEHGAPIHLGALRQIQTVREFDEHYTAPLSGFAGVDDYYRRAGMATRLHEIHTPTWIVAARDDPLVPFEAFRALLRGPIRAGSIRLLATDRGGHVAFIARPSKASQTPPGSSRRWAEDALVALVLLPPQAEGASALRSC